MRFQRILIAIIAFLLLSRCILTLILFAEFAESTDTKADVQDYALQSQPGSLGADYDVGRELMKGRLNGQRAKSLAEYTLATDLVMFVLLCIMFVSVRKKDPIVHAG